MAKEKSSWLIKLLWLVITIAVIGGVVMLGTLTFSPPAQADGTSLALTLKPVAP